MCLIQTFSTCVYFYQICSECSEPTLAQSLCILCNKWFCYQCTDVHQHHRATVAPQFSDLHHHQKVSAAPCPEHHHRGSSPVPASGQGKTNVHIHFSGTGWRINSSAAHCVCLCFAVWVTCFFFYHIRVEAIRVTNELQCWWLIMIEIWRSLFCP